MGAPADIKPESYSGVYLDLMCNDLANEDKLCCKIKILFNNEKGKSIDKLYS